MGCARHTWGVRPANRDTDRTELHNHLVITTNNYLSVLNQRMKYAVYHRNRLELVHGDV